MAECIVSAEIDWKAVADRISNRVSEAEPRPAAIKRPDNVIDLREARKRSLARHKGETA